ncbi:MAG: acetyltransferase [Candidatus Cloacimonetes bacterium]|nr:acetyltransferase [Candidatus Cloacimonadota bacterium]
MNKNISKTASIGDSTTTGFNVIIFDDVKIGENCAIGNNVIIYEGTAIGDNVRIDDNTIIGKKPMSSPRSIFKAAKDLKPAKIGNNCMIGANVIIYAQCKMGENNLVADLATLRENVIINDYNIIGRGVSIENFVKIGSRNKLETNTYITAYSEIEDYCFIAPCVATSNDNFMARDPERYKHFKGVTLKTGSRIGTNATILPGKIIENDGVIAAGSIASKDIPKEEVWLGTPAKFYKKVPTTQLLKNNLDKK